MKRSLSLRILIGCWILISSSPPPATASTLLYATTSNLTPSATRPGIIKIDENGTYSIWNIDWGGSPISFQNPQGIDLDSSGNVYVNDGSSIYKITPAGNGSLFATKPNANNALGLAVDNAGNVYAAGRSGSTDVIYRYDSAGLLTATWNGGATGMEVGPDGRLHASETNSTIVWRYDASGDRMGYAAQSGVWDISFDPDGYLYLSTLNRRIYRVGLNGSSIGSIYSSSSLTASAVEFDQKGILYIANRMSGGDNEIRTYNPSTGTASTFVNLEPDLRVNSMVAVPEPCTSSLVVCGILATGLRPRRMGQ